MDCSNNGPPRIFRYLGLREFFWGLPDILCDDVRLSTIKRVLDRIASDIRALLSRCFLRVRDLRHFLPSIDVD